MEFVCFEFRLDLEIVSNKIVNILSVFSGQKYRRLNLQFWNTKWTPVAILVVIEVL